MLAISKGFVITITHDITMFIGQKLSNISNLLWFTLKACQFSSVQSLRVIIT